MSIEFGIFLIITLLMFFLLPARYRLYLLLAAGYIFCYHISPKSLITLVIVTLFTYCAGIFIKKTKHSQAAMIISVLLVLITLLFYKFIPSLSQEIFKENTPAYDFFTRIAMPLGISFYIFQAIAYLVDCYKGKTEAVSNILEFALSMSFFPKLISGPIEKVQSFTAQRASMEQIHFWQTGKLSRALNSLLCGAFMKMAVADRAGILVDRIYEGFETSGSLTLLFGAGLYSIQIYADFAGYTFMAIGIGRLFGIELGNNFKTPYFAKGISDFWRRWHISLSSFLKEYIYIPLGGNRCGMFRKCLNALIVFAICGIWHGAGLNFLVWGCIHGIYTIVGNFVKFKSRIITFLLVTFAWIFFRAGSMGEAVGYITRMFTGGISFAGFETEIRACEFWSIEGLLLVFACGVLLILEILAYRKDTDIAGYLLDCKRTWRFIIYYLILIFLLVFGIYGSGFGQSQFIYMQF